MIERRRAAPTTLTSSIHAQASSLNRSSAPICWTPTLENTRSAPPSSSATVRAARSTSGPSPTSTRKPMLRTPNRAPRDAASPEARSPSMSSKATENPRAAQCSAKARPNPEPPPVTTAAPGLGASREPGT